MTTTETARYCHDCGTVTKHENGQCLDCRHDLHQEKVAWLRTKRKAFTIGISSVFIFGIMWSMATHFSGDDVARGVLVSLVSSISIWLGTSLKAENKAQ